MIVPIISSDYDLGVNLGASRSNSTDAKGAQSKLADPFGSDANAHIINALAAVTLARHLGVSLNYYNSHAEKRPQIGTWFIRATRRRDGRLLVQKTDPDDAPAILGIVDLHEVWFPGWLTFGEGKRAEWFNYRAPRPCYFVPQHALRPIEDLFRLHPVQKQLPPTPLD